MQIDALRLESICNLAVRSVLLLKPMMGRIAICCNHHRDSEDLQNSKIVITKLPTKGQLFDFTFDEDEWMNTFTEPIKKDDFGQMVRDTKCVDKVWKKSLANIC